MQDNANYMSPSGMTWGGKPTKVVKLKEDAVLVYFNNPFDYKRSDCIVELWKKVNKSFLGINYKTEIKVIAVFRIKNKSNT